MTTCRHRVSVYICTAAEEEYFFSDDSEANTLNFEYMSATRKPTSSMTWILSALFEADKNNSPLIKLQCYQTHFKQAWTCAHCFTITPHHFIWSTTKCATWCCSRKHFNEWKTSLIKYYVEKLGGKMMGTLWWIGFHCRVVRPGAVIWWLLSNEKYTGRCSVDADKSGT